MKKIGKLLSTILIVSLLLTGCSANHNEDTAESKEKNIEKEVEAKGSTENKKTELKTVAGTVAILDMLDILDVEIVARPSSKHKIPERYEDKAEIGRPMEPDIEKIKELDPDIFLSVESLRESLEGKLENIGVESVFLDTKSYEGVLSAMETLGELYGKEDLVEDYKSDVEAKVEEVIGQAKEKEPLRVMILFGTPKSITYATEKSFVGSLVKKLGCDNVVHELEDYDEAYVPVSMENILELQPDLILRLTHANPEESRKMFEKEFAENDIWQGLEAVKSGKVYDLDNEYFGVSGNAKIRDSIVELGKILYQ